MQAADVLRISSMVDIAVAALTVLTVTPGILLAEMAAAAKAVRTLSLAFGRRDNRTRRVNAPAMNEAVIAVGTVKSGKVLGAAAAAAATVIGGTKAAVVVAAGWEIKITRQR